MNAPSRFLPLSLAGLVLLALLPSAGLRAAVTAGGFAMVGYTDNAGTDSFSIVALETINANEVLYITNNGWSNASQSFDGASPAGLYGAGAEQLMRLEITSSVVPGTIISSSSSGPGYTWTTAGVIDTGNVANTQAFSALDLKHDGGFKDEIYIFQASDTNPLLNVTGFVYALDMGDPLENPTGFRELSGLAQGGNLPNGEVSLDGGFSFNTVDTVDLGDNTAVELNPDGDPIVDFFGGTFGLNMSDPDVIFLQTNGGTKSDWLALIADRSNWIEQSSQPSGNLYGAAPEPSRALLLLLGGVSMVLRRRRKCE